MSEVDAINGTKVPPTGAPAAPRSSAREARNANWYGWAAVDLSIHEGSNDSRLSSIAQNIRVMRSLDATAPITVRDEELAVIGSVLDLTDANLVPQIMRQFALGQTEATRLIYLMREAVTPTPPAPPAHRI